MLKHKCLKCGHELGYKWNTNLYRWDYKCPKCKTKLETTWIFKLAMFMSFLFGLMLTDYISPMIGTYQSHPQITKGVVTFFCIIAVWMVVSAITPNLMRIKDKQKK